MVTAKSIWELCYYDCIKHVTCQRTLYLGLGEAMRCEVKAQCRAARSGLNSSPEKKRWPLSARSPDSDLWPQFHQETGVWAGSSLTACTLGSRVCCVCFYLSLFIYSACIKLYNAIQHHNYSLKATLYQTSLYIYVQTKVLYRKCLNENRLLSMLSSKTDLINVFPFVFPHAHVLSPLVSPPPPFFPFTLYTFLQPHGFKSSLPPGPHLHPLSLLSFFTSIPLSPFLPLITVLDSQVTWLRLSAFFCFAAGGAVIKLVSGRHGSLCHMLFALPLLTPSNHPLSSLPTP